jgi:hypothetical protein
MLRPPREGAARSAREPIGSGSISRSDGDHLLQCSGFEARADSTSRLLLRGRSSVHAPLLRTLMDFVLAPGTRRWSG